MTALAPQHRLVDHLDGRSMRGGGGMLASAWRNLDLWGRRAILSVSGAVFAFAFGAAAADVVRLPADMNGPPPASDEMTVQSELPSIASARAYALDNPPTYVVPVPPTPAVAPDATTEDGGGAPKATQTAYDDHGDPAAVPEPQPAVARPNPGANDPAAAD